MDGTGDGTTDNSFVCHKYLLANRSFFIKSGVIKSVSNTDDLDFTPHRGHLQGLSLYFSSVLNMFQSLLRRLIAENLEWHCRVPVVAAF
jgi:hypothetical protein